MSSVVPVIDDVLADRAGFDGTLLACLAFGERARPIYITNFKLIATTVRSSFDIVYSAHSSTPGTTKTYWSCLLGYHRLLECSVSIGDSGYHRQYSICRADVCH